MQPERAALNQIVESIADGTLELDWDALEAELPTEQERRLVRQLRILACISEVHRSQPDDDELEPAEPAPAGVRPASPSATGAETERTEIARIVGRIEPVAAATEGPSSAPADLGPRSWGPLQLLEKVGEGTFGEVYRAFDTQLHREVAVKLLRAARSSIGLSDRVLKEGRVLAKVRNHNVVVVHGAESRDGRVGLWMEYIRGNTLENLLSTQGTFSAREAALIGQDLCRAIAAVHGAGLVHRDIKAQNVMRETGGRIVLMDFGAGQFREAAVRGPARLTGTPLYLAPEVLNGGEATIQSDIYSLGVLLYHLVTGDYPVRAGSVDDLRAAHAQRRGVRLQDARPELPDAFVHVVERATQPDPTVRFASAGEMLGELKAALSVAERRPEVRPAAASPALTRLARFTTARVAALAALAAVVVAVGVFAWRGARPVTGGGQARPVLAVLPFDRGADVADHVAADITESLSQTLSAIEGLRVVSRTSVAAAYTAGVTMPAVGAALGADLVVEGRITRSPGKLRAAIRLVGAQRDHTLLAETFVFDHGAPQAFERDALLAIARQLELVVPSSLIARIAGRGTHDDVRDLYARARYELQRGSSSSLDAAIVLFKRTLEGDPQFAPAYAGMARAYWHMATPDRPTSYFDLARNAATEALKLHSGAEAETILADMAMGREWDWRDADARFRKAIALDPSFLLARQRYAMLLSALGQTAAAVEQIQEAQRLDPLSSPVAVSTGTVLHYAGRHRDALAAVAHGVQLQPTNSTAYVVMGRVLAALQRFDEARTAFGKARELGTPGPAFVEAEVAALDAQSGQPGRAREALTHLESLALGGELDPAMIGFVYARLGEPDRAFEWFDRAVSRRSARLVWLKVDSRFEPVRGDPRFAGLVRALGLD